MCNNQITFVFIQRKSPSSTSKVTRLRCRRRRVTALRLLELSGAFDTFLIWFAPLGRVLRRPIYQWVTTWHPLYFTGCQSTVEQTEKCALWCIEFTMDGVHGIVLWHDSLRHRQLVGFAFRRCRTAKSPEPAISWRNLRTDLAIYMLHAWSPRVQNALPSKLQDFTDAELLFQH